RPNFTGLAAFFRVPSLCSDAQPHSNSNVTLTRNRLRNSAVRYIYFPGMCLSDPMTSPLCKIAHPSHTVIQSCDFDATVRIAGMVLDSEVKAFHALAVGPQWGIDVARHVDY